MDFQMAKSLVRHQINGIKAIFAKDEHANTDVLDIVKMLGMIVVIGAIFVFVADKTITATGTPSNANLSAMQTNILGSAQTGSSFIIVLIIAIIGGTAIAYMALFSGEKKAQ